MTSPLLSLTLSTHAPLLHKSLQTIRWLHTYAARRKGSWHKPHCKLLGDEMSVGRRPLSGDNVYENDGWDCSRDDIV